MPNYEGYMMFEHDFLFENPSYGAFIFIISYGEKVLLSEITFVTMLLLVKALYGNAVKVQKLLVVLKWLLFHVFPFYLFNFIIQLPTLYIIVISNKINLVYLLYCT